MTTNIFKPILFNTEMVQAILAGRKTQTRRGLKIQKPSDGDPNQEFYLRFLPNDQLGPLVFYSKKPQGYIWINCDGEISKYNVGNILWVRETFTIVDTKKHREDFEFLYEASYEKDFHRNIKWKPSIHMPKEAARIFLKVTNVRCERLQDISEEDAIAEGCKPVKHYSTGKIIYQDHSYYTKNSRSETGCFDNAKQSFETLWDSINAKKQPWQSNPWVWVYDFERIEKPENFLS